MTQRRAGRSLPDCPTQAASGPDVDQAPACASVYPVRGHSDLPPPEPCARPTSTKRCVAEIGRSTDQGGAAARRRVWRSPRRAPALWEAPRGASAPSLLRRGHQITYAQPARWPEAARSPSSSPADCPARGHRARSHGTPHLRGGRGKDGRVSFHLQAFPPSGPRTVLEVRQLLDAEEQRLITGTDDSLPPFGPEMTQFVDEIRRRWPSLEDDPGSPWSVSPGWKPTTGGGTGFAIVWSCRRGVHGNPGDRHPLQRA